MSSKSMRPRYLRKIEPLTADRLKEKLSYCKDTGLFHWIDGPLTGKQAGCISDDGYIHINIDRKMYRAHRLAFLFVEGKFPEKIVDHIDSDKQNNKWANLRHACHLINGRNRRRSKSNTSGVTGVFWDESYGKWRAAINNKFKRIHLSCDGSLFGAVCARKNAEKRLEFHENHGMEP